MRLLESQCALSQDHHDVWAGVEWVAGRARVIT